MQGLLSADCQLLAGNCVRQTGLQTINADAGEWNAMANSGLRIKEHGAWIEGPGSPRLLDVSEEAKRK
jgi:hypothetical protein